MSRLAKFLWGVLSLALASVGGYYVLKSEKVLNFTFPKTEFGEMLRGNLEIGREWVAEKISSLTAPAVKKGEEVVVGAIQNVKDEVEGVVDKAKLGAIDAVRKSLNEKFDDVVGSPGVAMVPGSGSTAASPQDSLAQIFPLSFSVKRGLPAVFVIKNVASTGVPLSYQVFWGDGRSEVGSITPSESKTLFHAWESTDEFLIKVITGASNTSKTHSSYIFVYP